MRGTRGGILSVRPAIILTGVLLAASCVAAFARGGAHGLRSTPGVQDTSPPYLSLDPDSLDFDEQVVGRWGRARRITVTNTGGQPLQIDSVSIGGDDARNFSVVKDTCTGAKVPAYRACVVDVNFGPSKAEGFDAELKLIDNAFTSPQTMRLEGEGVNSSMIPPFDEE